MKALGNAIKGAAIGAGVGALALTGLELVSGIEPQAVAQFTFLAFPALFGGCIAGASTYE